MAAAEPLEDEESTPLRHHHVEDDEIGIFAFGHQNALIAIAGDKDLIALRLENRPHRFDDLGIVINEEHTPAARGLRRALGDGSHRLFIRPVRRVGTS